MLEENKGLTSEELLANIEANDRMTPQEKLFAKLFHHETILVKDMDLLTLRAHREELARIAFEARARLSAADASEEKLKKASRGDGKAKGFERSLNTDESTTNAINTIKERQGRQTKAEKILSGLQAMYEKSGMTPAEAQKEAERLASAGTILARLKNKTSEEVKATEPKEYKPEEAKSFNPFEKKENKS